MTSASTQTRTPSIPRFPAFALKRLRGGRQGVSSLSLPRLPLLRPLLHPRCSWPGPMGFAELSSRKSNVREKS